MATVHRTRATRGPDASAARAAGVRVPLRAVRMLALIGACALVTLVAVGPQAATASVTEPSLRSRTDAQLQRLAGDLDAEAASIGERLLVSDARRAELVRERDSARVLLAGFLGEAYKREASGGSYLGAILASTSLREAADRLRIAQAIGEHHVNLLRGLDAAEANLDVGRVERAQLITRLSAAQAQLLDVVAEQDRRSMIRAELAAERAARQAAADERAARAAPAAAATVGTLVSDAGFAAPSGPPSAALIDAYLASKGSPMAGQGAAFMASAIRWRVDPRLLVAIAGAESSFGQVTCGPHNAWGWACPNDPADFTTWADGIETVTSGLRRYYLDEGRTSVSLIQQKYCPVGAANDPTGLNSHWSTNVTKFLLEMGGNPAMVGPGPSGGAMLIPDFGGLGIAVD